MRNIQKPDPWAWGKTHRWPGGLINEASQRKPRWAEMPAFLTVLDAWALAFHFPRTTSRMVFIQKFGDPCCFCPRRKNSWVCGVGRCVNGGGEKQGVLQMGTLLCPSLGFSCPQVIIFLYIVVLFSPFFDFSLYIFLWEKKKGEESQIASYGKVYAFYFWYSSMRIILLKQRNLTLSYKSNICLQTQLFLHVLFFYTLCLSTL